MSEMILHHYAASPYSEKVRAMLGYTGMRWESVTVREMPPRPALHLLASGYRRIPVAQIGADIFCDSKAIAVEIARISGKADLSMETCDPEVRAYANRAESEFILACQNFLGMAGTFSGTIIWAKLLRGGPGDL